MKVLVVEDEEAIRDLVSAALVEGGHAVQVAADGATALKLLDDVRPEALVVDINMPGMDGFSFLEKVRDIPAHASVPAMMLTAQSAPEDIRRSLQLGALDFIGKPFDVRLFLRRFERMTRAVAS